MADPTPADVQKIIEDQREEAWENSYLNPINTETAQETADEIINHGIPVNYES